MSTTPTFEAGQPENGELLRDYSIEVGEDLAMEFLDLVDARIHPSEAELVLSVGGIANPSVYGSTVEGQREYIDTCEEQGAIPYSAITIDQSSGRSPQFIVENMGVDPHGFFPGRNHSIARGISSRNGFQKITYRVPDNSTIHYGANLKELREGGYAITDAVLIFRATRNDKSPESIAGSLSLTRVDDIYRFAININSSMPEQEARELRTLIEALELAKDDSDGDFDMGSFLYGKHKAEIEAIGARPIDNVKESNYFGQIMLAAIIFSKPDIGLEAREGQYQFGSPRKLSDQGYSVWAELGKYAQSRLIYEELGRNGLISTISSASYMSWVGPNIIFRDFDEHLIKAGVTDPEEVARYKATIAKWAIMEIDQIFEDAGWDENGYDVPTRYASERQETRMAYQAFLEESDAEPFSDQDIAQRVATVIDEESSRNFRWH